MINPLPKIDSLRLILPLNQVSINPEHPEFLRQLTTINDDGEIIDSKTANTYRLHSNPCSAHYLKATTIIDGIAQEVIKVGFSSKTLKENYFDGINADNINSIYDFIISENVIKFSKETFLSAKVVDVDICLDITLKDSNVREVVKHAKKLSIKHKETSSNAFTKVDNVGIEWGHRNKVGKSYKKKQYLKYYAKGIELKNNSVKFYDAYIRNNPINNYINENKSLRVETTIKNNAHWGSYGVSVKTLDDLLALDLSKHKELFNRPINHYMNGNKTLDNLIKTSLTPSEKIYLLLIKESRKNYDLDDSEIVYQIIWEIHPSVNEKSHRSRLKKKLTTLINENRVEIIENKNTNQLIMFSETEQMGLFPKQ